MQTRQWLAEMRCRWKEFNNNNVGGREVGSGDMTGLGGLYCSNGVLGPVWGFLA